MNSLENKQKFPNKLRPFYLVMALSVLVYAFWARQQEGFIHVSGLVLLLASFAGISVARHYEDEFVGWLYGIGSLVLLLLLFGGRFLFELFRMA